MIKRAIAILLAASAIAAGGCDPRSNDIPQSMETSSPDFAVQAQEIVNRYALGLYQRDVPLMDELLASEVLTRMKGYQGGLEGFVEQQRRMMLRTFDGMESAGMGNGFEVTKVTKQEGTVAVQLSRNGVALPRPFHFVLENGAYKLNIAPKGFSRPLPAGAGANSNYLVSNNASYPVSAYCLQGGSVNVAARSSATVSCPNACGRWFAGAYFDGSNWIGQTHYCDYNTWGADVIYDGNFAPPATIPGMHCNDPC